MTHSVNDADGIYRDIASVSTPTLFSDGLLSYSIGHQVSRLTLGVETQPGVAAAPIVNIILPTEALLTIITDLRTAFKNPEVQQHMIDAINRLTAKTEALDD